MTPACSSPSVGSKAAPGVSPPLGPVAPIGHQASRTAAALHRHGRLLIAAVQAAAPGREEAAFARAAAGEPQGRVLHNLPAQMYTRNLAKNPFHGVRGSAMFFSCKLGGVAQLVRAAES